MPKRDTNLSQQGEEACVCMGSDAILVSIRVSWWVVRQAESEHWRLESCLKEVLVEVKRCRKYWKQGEGKRLHGSGITKHLKPESDSEVAAHNMLAECTPY